MGPTFRLWSPVVAYMAALYWLASISNVPALPEGLTDKEIHVLMYAGLASVSVRALARGEWGQVTFLASLGAIAIASAYGVFDEFHQTWVPRRTFDTADILADAIGAGAAAIALWAWSILRARQPPHTRDVL